MSSVKPNALIHEKSPYLLQHAHNPVDWMPWGDAAFARARSESKPIFLSIGYSTCHWCHVMERESFANADIAALMNRNFVCIKVDREERPDVDKIYMTAVQAITGQGGWPLNAWLTPGLKPFYGGTYFPPESRWGRPGFPEILERIAEMWTAEREKLEDSGRQIQELLAQSLGGRDLSGALDPKALDSAFKYFSMAFDEKWGGFREAPKFPMPVYHNFLLRYYASTKKQEALDMSLETLRAIAAGGIYDQIGGGFHRYSTDERWHVPHFEKMLYDNAQLAVNYIEAFQISGDENFARVARETLDYVLRDMSHPDGGLYSAEDADSLPPELVGQVEDKGHEHRAALSAELRGQAAVQRTDDSAEGAFYIWKYSELMQLLGPVNGEIFCLHYGASPNGNAESDPQGEFENKNILFFAHNVDAVAARFKKSPEEVRRILDDSRRKVFMSRERRPRPQRDDKILASWNGLALSAFAKAAQVFDDAKYREAAQRIARFLKTHLYDAKDGRLYRRWRDGARGIPGTADDHAFLAQGLLDLYEADFDAGWLAWAETLTQKQNDLFLDRERGGFYMTASDHDGNISLRSKEDMDNVEPSAASVAALNLLRLAELTDRDDFRKIAEQTLISFGSAMGEQPQALPQMLVALDYYFAKPRQIVVAGERDGTDTRALLREVHQRFLPHKIVFLLDGSGAERELLDRLPYLKDMAPVGGKASAYVCVDRACALPVNEPGKLAEILAR